MKDEARPAALRGFETGTDAYVRGRPDFPDAALDWLRTDLDLRPGKTALDLGAGTGKFTRPLMRTGANATAIEPVSAMRERLQRDLPAVTTVAGRAEQIPLSAACADAVVCAQA